MRCNKMVVKKPRSSGDVMWKLKIGAISLATMTDAEIGL
jgi:hypothetical protein